MSSIVQQDVGLSLAPYLNPNPDPSPGSEDSLLLSIQRHLFYDDESVSNLDKCKQFLFSCVNRVLSFVFLCFIAGKTLDCLTPIYQTEKLFIKRFGGDSYSNLVRL